MIILGLMILGITLGLVLAGLMYCAWRFYRALQTLTSATDALVGVLKPLMDNHLLGKGLNGVNLLADAMPSIFTRLDSVVATLTAFNQFAFAAEQDKTLRPVATPNVSANSAVYAYDEVKMAEAEAQRAARETGWEVNPAYSPQMAAAGMEVPSKQNPQSTPA